ncbi:MAG TPA: hypothetical protein DF712_00140, partial [Balneola sp.]|nr:hypothetical protein [Balneola sp.]
VDNIIDYSKELKDNLSKISTKAREIRKIGFQVYAFINKNKESIYDSMLKVAKIIEKAPESEQKDFETKYSEAFELAGEE